jgi:hypothetical protein
MEDYQIATYVDLNGAWWAITASTVVLAGAEVGLIAIPLWLSRPIVVFSLAANLGDMVNDAVDMPIVPNGPIDGIYPTVYYDPLHIGRAPWQLHIRRPRGRWEQ